MVMLVQSGHVAAKGVQYKFRLVFINWTGFGTCTNRIFCPVWETKDDDVRAYKLAINDESEGVIFLPQHIVPHPLEQSEITLSCSPSGV